MSEMIVENILKQIAALPFIEQQRLHDLLGDRLRQPTKRPLDRHGIPIPEPDYREAMQWLAEHAREYAGQWVALEGNRLIAHGPDARAVYAAANADGAYLPLVTLVEDPDAPPFAGF